MNDDALTRALRSALREHRTGIYVAFEQFGTEEALDVLEQRLLVEVLTLVETRLAGARNVFGVPALQHREVQ